MQNQEFSGIAKLGWIMLQYMKSQKKLELYLNKRKENYDMGQLSNKIYEATQSSLLELGGHFGDLSVIGRKFKPHWTVVRT